MTQKSGNSRRRRFDPIRREGVTTFSFEPPEFFPAREAAARLNTYPHEAWFIKGLNLAYRLFTARAPTVYTDEAPIVLGHLCIKALNDLLVAVSVVKSGYHFQSWPLLRGGLEAAELMDYFLRHPDEIRGWLNKDKRFDSISWVRRHLPHTEPRNQFFDLLNENSHANFRNIAVLSAWKSGPGKTTQVVGPLPFPIQEPNPLTMAANLISYPIRVLWLAEPDAVSSEWISEFNDFDLATGFLLGEDWTSKSAEDLVREPPG